MGASFQSLFTPLHLDEDGIPSERDDAVRSPQGTCARAPPHPPEPPPTNSPRPDACRSRETHQLVFSVSSCSSTLCSNR